MVRRLSLTLALALMAAPAFAADYQVHLGPMPLDDETKQVIAGGGNATITSDGKTLTVTGDFHGLPSSAIAAHVFVSPIAGVPGKQVADLEITKSTSGTVSGDVKLNGAQATALRTGRLYIRIDSEKAPEDVPWGAKGTLWGWIFPAHETVGQDLPQEGHWFIPQLDTPSR
jgi:CHRD domain